MRFVVYFCLQRRHTGKVGPFPVTALEAASYADDPAWKRADCLAIGVNCCCRCSQPATCLAICYIELFFVMPFHLDDFIVCAGVGWDVRMGTIDWAKGSLIRLFWLNASSVAVIFGNLWKGARSEIV